MTQKPGTAKQTVESMVKDIRQRTGKHHSAEERIRVVLEGPRGEDCIAALTLENHLLKTSMLGDGGDEE